MREIKFRGMVAVVEFNTVNKPNTFVYGYFYEECGRAFIIEDRQRREESNLCRNTPNVVVPESVGQFTGLKDKDGVEIYEGDILYCEIEEYKGSVFFRGGQFLTEARGWGDLPLADDVDIYKVIGNIHENPDLLEK